MRQFRDKSLVFQGDPQLVSKDRDLWKLYRIGIVEYNSMLIAQDNECAICGVENIQFRQFAVDHDKETGKIRGLLCNNCNIGLGHFEHNIEYLERALDYLKRNQ